MDTQITSKTLSESIVKTAKSPVLSFSTVANWGDTFAGRLEGSEKLLPYMGARLHYQLSNVKTGSLGEGTAAMLTCLHGTWTDWTADGVERGVKCGIVPPCARSCYALRQMIQYPNYAAAMVRNTLLRRADCVQYYADFFDRAASTPAKRLRINESGDFEMRDQVRACFDAARNHADVTAWGYTQRPADWIDGAPSNVRMRVSCWTDLDRARDLVSRGYYVAVVHETRSTCPSQLGRVNDGGKPWTCADCAARKCGCCGGCKAVFFRKH